MRARGALVLEEHLDVVPEALATEGRGGAAVSAAAAVWTAAHQTTTVTI